ncbi:MAG: hypothetical protein WCW33_00205 [Candidatus Babeliales bacterium]|jgi:hypothetical protein
MQLQCPILFLIFNRPDTTNVVFEEIRKQRPRLLFIAADGPRPTHVDDNVRCAQARSILDRIDWPCTVHTLFRDQNLGCGSAVSESVTWFFAHVEEGIVLEDDCVPDPTFFDFCAAMLDRYRDNPKIMMIAGTSYLFNTVQSRESYFFSRYYPVWGWATWRRAWQLYDFDLREWAECRPTHMLKKVFNNKKIVNFWTQYFDRIVRKDLDTWDIQWTYACIKHQALCVVPFNNLISNIGYFGLHATGEKSFDHGIELRPLDCISMVHSETVNISAHLDLFIYKKIGVVTHYGLLRRIRSLSSAVKARLMP